ncbi:ubiquitin-conjugating enzyme/RWD-like protein [Gigaspora rosea]|uniref:Ubiquitin-conjugating enzyme/RWD-like protein n=1 Tax=Gigaspora rosea TaxID=44941 RepID=A0A397UYG3_9GLOM|nr:ubiquitin-conjugating enzyme/RWD-like protein [Gigaspora rosea]
MSTTLFSKRLSKELIDLKINPPAGIEVAESDTFKCWKLSLDGVEGTLYAGERFTLEFRFTPNYPMESPEVVFVGNIPIHPHIYSNGHICLNVLYNQWSPVLSVRSVCLSIQSMLSSCTTKEPPPDNNHYVKTAKASPKQTQWSFHDDSV